MTEPNLQFLRFSAKFFSFPWEEDKRATTNVQNRFVQFFLLSFLLFCSPCAETLCFEGESPGGKIMKKCQKVRKSARNYETILPFSCCPLVFLWFLRPPKRWICGLDGLAIRNANRGDSRESIRASRFAEKPLFSACASDSRESP